MNPSFVNRLLATDNGTGALALRIPVAMLVAVFAVHWSKGFFAAAGGYEYALALLAVSLALVFSGAGRLSIDRAIVGAR